MATNAGPNEPVDNQANKSVTVASKVSFGEICGLLEKITRIQGNDKKKRFLKDFVDHWRDFHSTLHKDKKDVSDSFYPAMRLMLPQLEKERVAYGIKENMLAKLLIEVLCLGKESPDAQKLLHYKAPKNARGDAGDFAGVAYFVLKNRCPEKGSLTIEEVNECLDGIAKNNAAKNKELVRKNILHLLKNLSAVEQKWLIRMIVKEMKIGLSQSSVLSVYHPDAEDFYNVNNNMEKVCRLLRDLKTRVHEIGVSVFSPFSPMLGERGAPDKVEKLMENQLYFIETKYDGERMLLHKHEDEYKYFSRSGNEYTHVFGSNSYDGSLTPYIVNCFKPGVTTCILDGEMLGYDAATKTFGTKGERFDIKSTTDTGTYQPCLHVFDILLFNDKVLTNLPLRERLTYLEKVFNPAEGRLLISEVKQGKTNQDCVDALNEAIDNREEGIMVKNPETVYRPNTRKGGWFKIKPEYISGLMDELDVLIVGGYFGVGHRGGMMSHFLCAVAVPTDDGSEPSVFYSFCKVGSGYSKKELSEYNRRMIDHWQVFDKKSPPTSLILASGFKEKPDAWIEPSKSFILQIKAAEIIESDRYKAGCTLRFPRVEKIRDDKLWSECMTTADIEDLRQKSGGKLSGKRLELETENEPVKKKRKIISRIVKPTIGAQFKKADTSNVTQISKIFEDKEFCVINGPSKCPKAELEKKVVEFGGTVVQNPGSETFCVLAEKVAIRVKNLISRNIYDVVKVDWFLKCVSNSQWIPWSPSDMLHTSPKTEAHLKLDYDVFGDSYTEDTSTDQLLSVFDKMSPGQDFSIMTTSDIADLESRHFPDDSPYGLFRTCRLYLDINRSVGDPSTKLKDSSLELLALELRFFGATLANQLDENVSHVMMDNSDLTRLADFKVRRRARPRKFHIVTEHWVRQCIEEGELCQERPFEPV